MASSVFSAPEQIARFQAVIASGNDIWVAEQRAEAVCPDHDGDARVGGASGRKGTKIRSDQRLGDDHRLGLEAFYAALWIGALMVAIDALADPFPDGFDQLAAMYFELFPPVAKA